MQIKVELNRGISGGGNIGLTNAPNVPKVSISDDEALKTFTAPHKELVEQCRNRYFEEDSLRQDPYQRDKNAIVAYELLPLFQNEPTGWNAVGHLPNSSAKLNDYLREWYTKVDVVDKPFLKRTLEAFELNP